MNNDGTVVESIESPNIHQHRGLVDSRKRQHVDTESRFQNKPVLIDLTNSAEKAVHRRPVSPDAMQVSYQERPSGDAQMYAMAAPQQRRQLIELNDNIPSRSVYRPEDVRQPIRTVHEQYITRPYAREIVDQAVYRQDVGPAQVSYGHPAERRVLREPVIDRQPINTSIRYVTNEPTSVVYSDRNAQAYRTNGNEQMYQLPSQQYVTNEPSRRIIVLDTGDPMEDVQRTTDPRYV